MKNNILLTALASLIFSGNVLAQDLSGLGPGPATGGRGTGHHAHARRGRHDHGVGDPRNPLRHRDVSDRVAFFRNGLVHEIGSPDQVIGNPTQPETAAFLKSVK